MEAGVLTTLYCQQIGCGHPLEEERTLLQKLELFCPSCGCVYRQGSMSDDEFAAWLAFPPGD